MTSGDPRKQQRPDGNDQTVEVTKALPPSLSMVMTEVEASVVQFPAFPGHVAVDFCAKSGDLQVHMHIPPQAVEVVIDALRQAKMKAETGIQAVGADALEALKNGNGKH